MRRALDNAAAVRTSTSPNPWVGAVVVTADGEIHDGATEPPGGRHAEIVALDAADDAADGSTLVVTLEPCGHHGRTPPCTDAIVDRRVARVVYAVDDPDPKVAGGARARLEAAGVEVVTGCLVDEVTDLLRPYITHRTTGRPFVVLKLAATLDGRIAAPDGTSRWITGAAAREDVHRRRAESDAIMVGSGTVRADDPSLTTRAVDGRDPVRVVLGTAPPGARVHPCLEVAGELEEVLDHLGAEGIVQLLVEGGADVAGHLHRAGLVDRYVVYVAPKLAGGDDGVPMFAGPGAVTMSDVWSGRLRSVERFGDDVRFVIERAG